MSNWLAGIYQAGSGLDAARYGLSVVSQNMANAGNAAYTKQTAQFAAVDLSPVSGISTGRGSLGGVAVTGTARSSDPVLMARVRTEDAKGSQADTTAAQLSDVVAVLGEPSDSGLSSQLNDFWNAWGRVGSAPSSTAARTVLLRSAGSVAATLNGMASALDDVATGQASALQSDVDSVNSAATRLADLNGQIAVGTATGANVNSLLDERDTLLDNLSTLAGAGVQLEANGSATVTVGGRQLVSGTTAHTMSVDMVGTAHSVTVDGAEAAVATGSIAARRTALTTTLPGYRATLDSVATSLATTVNTAQRAGYDQNGTAGGDMFTATGAGDLTVSLTDPAGVAASGVAGGGLDNSVAVALSQAGSRTGSADAVFSTLVGTVASAASTAAAQSTTQSAVRSYVTNLKTSMSGVSFDEEAATMIAFQQSFNASSRVLTAIDSMLDTLINHTGLVGRG